MTYLGQYTCFPILQMMARRGSLRFRGRLTGKTVALIEYIDAGSTPVRGNAQKLGRSISSPTNLIEA